MEEKELWMNKLKEKLGDYSEPLPASGWEQLEKELMPPVERKIYRHCGHNSNKKCNEFKFLHIL